MRQASLTGVAGQGLEQVVTGDEVGFGVDFDGGGDHAGALGFRSDDNQAFGGDAVGLLGGLAEALGAQPVHGGVDVAIVLGQGLLAVHHAHARLFAQVLNESSCDFSHEILQ